MCSDSYWLTTTELYQLHGIPVKLALYHAKSLRVGGLARRTGEGMEGPGSNPWLFHPDTVEFLLERVGRQRNGRPLLQPTDEEVDLLLETWDKTWSITACHEALKEIKSHAWTTVRRWLRELGRIYDGREGQEG